MRKQTKGHRFLDIALAAILACGMMVPMGAIAWADDENSNSTTFDKVVEEAPQQGSSVGDAVSYVAQTAIAMAVPEAAPSAPVAAPMASVTLTKGGYTLVGEGLVDADFEATTTNLTIKTSKTVTISNTGTNTVGIIVPNGVEATLVLNGVNVSASWPLDIKAGGICHLVLADGSKNTFGWTGTEYRAPGIHCGTGARLTIDDAVPNVDILGNAITPQKGLIPVGTQYVDNTGKTRTSTGDSLSLLDSTNPGTLTVTGGGQGAAIGGSYMEDGGNMTFNGGILTVTNGSGTTTSSGDRIFGAGIGGGGHAAGTSPSEWITFNGGKVNVSAAYHGAGIGGGWNQATKTIVSGLTQSQHPAGTGNIRINGGYIVSKGGNDGNGFGRGCYGQRVRCDNRDYTILITGGTMIPTGGTNLGVWGMDIGGSGTDPSSGTTYTLTSMAANVCISGGSVYVGAKDGGGYRFDGTAYGTFTENADGSITVNKDAQVVPITIDLTADLMALDGLTTKPAAGSTTLNRTVSTWDLLVNGEVVNYGAPAQFNEGKLYLWLTPEQAAQNVEVRLSYKGPEGNVNVEPLYRPAGSSSSQTNLKRYVYFNLQSDFYNQVGGGTGTGTVAYDALSSYEQKKYADSVDASGNVVVPTVTKPYDGLPYSVRELSASSPINSGGDDKMNIYSNITYVAQLYDPSTGRLGAEQTTTTLPSDTGLTRFTMTSTQYANDPAYSTSYYGHRAYGWCAITPVPAVVKIAETDGTAWVCLAEDGASYKLVKEGDTEAGNRLRVAFDVRSAKGTAKTCAAPTGSFQILIDGKPIGGPVALSSENVSGAVGGSKGSSIETVTGDEGRATTRVVYYLDPTNLDGALEALEGADSNVHDITVQYLPDKNYVEGVEEDTPDDEKTVATQPTTIIPVKPTGDVTPDGPADITVITTPDPAPGPGGDPEDPTDKMTVIRKTVRASYSEFHNGDVTLDDFFKLKIVSSSDMPPAFTVSNPAVADVLPNADGTLALDAEGKLPVQVNSCGTSVITMEQKGNAIYTGTKYILTVEVTPDKTLKPQVQIRLTSRNLTALLEKAEEAAGTEIPEGDVSAMVSVVAAVYAFDATRADLPPRPGDVMEYTVTGINMTPGSAWQGAELTDAISATLSFDANSVEVASNYTTHSDKYTLGTAEFYRDFNWDGLDWEPVAPTDYTFASQTLTKGVGSVYGGQSTSVRFQATVADHTGDRPENEDELPVITSEPGGSGGYGKEEGDLAPGEEPGEVKPLTPGTDIVVVGEGGTADDDPMDPKDEKVVHTDPVLPKDPGAADIVTVVKVDVIDTEEVHEPDRILVGDTLRVTATSTNNGPDSKLVDAIIKVTLPKGAEPKAGTIKLKTPDGKEYSVPDSAYDPTTGIIAVSAGDLYGGESATLTFEATIESTRETRGPEEQGGSRPDDFPIQGGTLGGTPTGEYIDTHPDGPDGPAVQADKPEPGVPFVPGEPWDELEKKVVTGEPGTDINMPPVLPKNPRVDGDNPDIVVEKTAENTTRDDGTTHVGDTIRYTIKVSNSKAHSIWYDAVVRDNLPKGVEPMSGTIKMTGPDGVERPVPDSAYDAATRIMGVEAGDLPGGREAELVFEALITEEAKDTDIGNVGTAYGTKPGDVDPGEVGSGEVRPTPGTPFQPEEGWGSWSRGKEGVSNDQPAYAPGTSGIGGVLDMDGGPGSGLLAATGITGNGGGQTILAKTGDNQSFTMIGLAFTASAALLVLLIAARRNRNRERL